MKNPVRAAGKAAHRRSQKQKDGDADYFSSIRAALFGGRQSVAAWAGARLRDPANLENAVNFVLSSRDG